MFGEARAIKVFWGVFQDEMDDVHILPCDIQGNMLSGHIMSPSCSCSPVLNNKEGDVSFLFVHNHINNC